MLIICKTPNEIGGYPPIQDWPEATPPDGYFEVNCDTSGFYQYRGFVTPEIVNNVAIRFTGNQDALDAYLVNQPDKEPAPTPEEQNAADIAYLALMMGVDL